VNQGPLTWKKIHEEIARQISTNTVSEDGTIQAIARGVSGNPVRLPYTRGNATPFQVVSQLGIFGASFGSSASNGDQTISSWKVTGVTAAVPDTEFSLAHGLARVPIGFFTAYVDAAANLYKSSTAWTTTSIYLKCDMALVNYFVVII
jgi:hypothetical protein